MPKSIIAVQDTIDEIEKIKENTKQMLQSVVENWKSKTPGDVTIQAALEEEKSATIDK